MPQVAWGHRKPGACPARLLSVVLFFPEMKQETLNEGESKNFWFSMGDEPSFILHGKETPSLEKPFICSRDCLLLQGGSGRCSGPGVSLFHALAICGPFSSASLHR